MKASNFQLPYTLFTNLTGTVKKCIPACNVLRTGHECSSAPPIFFTLQLTTLIEKWKAECQWMKGMKYSLKKTNIFFRLTMIIRRVGSLIVLQGSADAGILHRTKCWSDSGSGSISDGCGKATFRLGAFHRTGEGTRPKMLPFSALQGYHLTRWVTPALIVH